jgi:hypothetical protein
MGEKMMRKGLLVLTAMFFAGTFLIPRIAGAIEVKKHMMGGDSGPAPVQQGPVQEGPAPRNSMTKGQQSALQDALANDSEPFVGQESEKKSSGEPYIDLEHAKFSYMPGSGSVTAKLIAPEYKRSKNGSGKGTATGNQKALVFKYKMNGNTLTPEGEPKWEDAKGK